MLCLIFQIPPGSTLKAHQTGEEKWDDWEMVIGPRLFRWLWGEANHPSTGLDPFARTKVSLIFLFPVMFWMTARSLLSTFSNGEYRRHCVCMHTSHLQAKKRVSSVTPINLRAEHTDNACKGPGSCFVLDCYPKLKGFLCFLTLPKWLAIINIILIKILQISRSIKNNIKIIAIISIDKCQTFAGLLCVG